MSLNIGTQSEEINTPDAEFTDSVYQERPERRAFIESLPARPYCMDYMPGRMLIRNRSNAIRFRHVQLNSPQKSAWLTFDIDREGAYYAANDANLPAPNFIAVNPDNRHAHIGYRLETPVLTCGAASMKPVKFLADIERGYRRRLDADLAYSGLITKNPLHSDWISHWPRLQPYDLGELDDWLFPDNKAFDVAKRAEHGLGFGRNCELFDTLRHFAYRERKQHTSSATFQTRLLNAARGFNTSFSIPLPESEVRSISKSVAKWVWLNLNPERFSAVQSFRSTIGKAKAIAKLGAMPDIATLKPADIANVTGKSVRTARRYRKELPTTESVKPWQLEGISRRSWYRNNPGLRSAVAQKRTYPYQDNSPLPGSSVPAPASEQSTDQSQSPAIEPELVNPFSSTPLKSNHSETSIHETVLQSANGVELNPKWSVVL
jgi:hypothetical protein